MKLLHTADWHTRDNDIEEITKCLLMLVDVARDEKPDLIIHAGDVFDNQHVRLDSKSSKLVFSIFSMLAMIAPIVAITGTKSHDGKTIDVMSQIKGKYPIYVADYPEQVALVKGLFVPLNTVTDPDVIISMVPTPTKQYWQEFGGKYESAKETDAEVAQAMGAMLAGFGAEASMRPSAPHILVAHCQIGGAFLSETQQLVGQDIELSRDQIGYAEADLVCLGHIHYPQSIDPNIFYSGAVYAHDWGELHDHGFYTHELTDGPTYLLDSKFHRTPARKLIKLKTDLTNGGRSVESMMADGAWEYDIAGAFVRLEIKAWQDEADLLDLSAIRAALGAAQDVDIRLQRVPRETVRSAHLLELQALRDKIQEMALLRKEDVPEAILAKADMLETLDPDEIYKGLAA
jgi:exonuclease SbcD